MITYKVTYDAERVVEEIIIKGHATAGPSGENVICAAVSTAVLMTVNAIKYLKAEFHVDIESQDGYFRLYQKSYSNIVNPLMRNLVNTMEELIKKYPDQFEVE